MASSSKEYLTYPALLRRLDAGQFSPVYLLHGEEGYFTDELVKCFESILPEEERDFNLYTFYGGETGPDAVIECCRRFPMMAERQVVILKEAQAMRADHVNKLHHYVRHPNPSTILVIAFRGAKAKGKELLAAVKEEGVLFESLRINDRDILPAIHDLISEKGLSVDAKAISMLRDFIGTDMSRLYNEIDKLAFILGPGAMITPEAVERNVGISKDYNNFEFIDAIDTRNAAKAFAIVAYFAANPKSNPTVVTAGTLFTRFSNLLIYHYTRDKSRSGYMEALGLKKPSALWPYEKAARSYNVRQTIEILSAIREFDVRSKGVGSRQNEYALLKDLVFRIFTARGVIRMD